MGRDQCGGGMSDIDEANLAVKKKVATNMHKEALGNDHKYYSCS